MLETSFGSIRQFRPEDAPALARYANNREIWLNLRDGFPYPYTEASAQFYLDLVSKQNPLTSFAMASPDEVIGAIGMTVNSDVHRLTAELGYWLAEPFWGKGIVTEAVTCLTAWAFEHLSLQRIYAEPFANNIASCRVLEKAGFTLEGRMRKNAIKDGVLLDQFLSARSMSRGGSIFAPCGEYILQRNLQAQLILAAQTGLIDDRQRQRGDSIEQICKTRE